MLQFRVPVRSCTARGFKERMMSTETSAWTDERLVAVGPGIELCVRTAGDPAGEPLLLIHGLAMQQIAWPDAFVDPLVAAGFHLIRFDNRDIGLSSRLTEVPVPGPLQLLRRRFDARQYELSDMAQDAAGLIAELDLGPVHVVGVSMGGMIAQTLAARHAGQVRSLTSIMSTTGSTKYGQPARSTWLRMAQPPTKSRSASIERSVSLFKHIGSRGFPFDEAEVREGANLAFDRAHDAAGPTRQLAAILKSGDRSREVRTIVAPTLVIHGSDDRMVNASGGRATAAAVRDARFELIKGMGHDLPAAVRPRLAEMIIGHARAAGATATEPQSLPG
jgi:pimeloyl-ACP methyl ester carboxylesterase